MNLPFARHDRIRENLSAYIDGELLDADRAEVESHIASCAECRRDLDTLRSTVSLLRAMPPVAAPRSFAIRPNASAPPLRPHDLSRLFFGLRNVTGLAAAVLVAVLGVNLLAAPLQQIQPPAGVASRPAIPAAAESQPVPAAKPRPASADRPPAPAAKAASAMATPAAVPAPAPAPPLSAPAPAGARPEGDAPVAVQSRAAAPVSPDAPSDVKRDTTTADASAAGAEESAAPEFASEEQEQPYSLRPLPPDPVAAAATADVPASLGPLVEILAAIVAGLAVATGLIWLRDRARR